MQRHGPMSSRARAAVFAIAALGLVSYAKSAQADAAAGPAWSGCQVNVGANAKSLSLPANAPAVLLTDNTTQGLTATVSAELVTGQNRVALTAGKDAHGLFAMPLPTSVAPGSHTIDMTLTCSNTQPEQTSQVALTLTAPVALPTEVGTLQHIPSNPPTGIDKIRLVPTPSMSAFFAASTLEVNVNGAVSEGRQYAASKGAPIEFSAHTGDVCVENGVLHREQRVVKVDVVAHVAGLAQSPTPATIDVPVDCGAIKWTSGTTPPGETTTTPGQTPSPATTTTPSSNGSSESAATCSMHHGALGSSAPLLALALGGLVVAARRRRRA